MRITLFILSTVLAAVTVILGVLTATGTRGIQNWAVVSAIVTIILVALLLLGTRNSRST